MRRIIGLIACIVFLVSTTVVYAAPVGNIATPSVLKKGLVIQNQEGQFGVIAGPEVDLTWDQNFKDQETDTEYYFYGGKIGVLFMDRFVAYTVLGAAEAKKQEYNISGTKIRWDTKYDFAWTVGGTLMLWETQLASMGNGTLRIGVDGRYRQSHLKVDEVVMNGTAYKTSSANVTSSKYEPQQWQVCGAISYQIDKFVPYFGVKYSDVTGEAKATINSTEYKYDFKQKDNVGIFVGGDLVINETASLNVEGRFLDETALTLGGLVRF